MMRWRGRTGQHHENLLQALAQLHHLLLLQNLHVAASLDTLVQVQHRPPPAANLPNPPAPSLLNPRTTLMFASFSTLTTLPSSPSSVGLQRFSRSRSLARPRARSRTCPCTVARAPGRSLELVFVTRRLRPGGNLRDDGGLGRGAKPDRDQPERAPGQCGEGHRPRARAGSGACRRHLCACAICAP